MLSSRWLQDRRRQLRQDLAHPTDSSQAHPPFCARWRSCAYRVPEQRQLNQSVFEKLYVDEDQEIVSVVAEPYRSLLGGSVHDSSEPGKSAPGMTNPPPLRSVNNRWSAPPWLTRGQPRLWLGRTAHHQPRRQPRRQTRRRRTLPPPPPPRTTSRRRRPCDRPCCVAPPASCTNAHDATSAEARPVDHSRPGQSPRRRATIATLATEFGIHRTTVISRLRHAGLGEHHITPVRPTSIRPTRSTSRRRAHRHTDRRQGCRMVGGASRGTGH